MAFEQFMKIIDGKEYQTTLWSGSKAFRIKYRLVNALSEPLENILKGFKVELTAEGKIDIDSMEKTNILDKDIDISFIARAFGSLYKSLGADEALKLLQDIFAETMIENRSVKFDTDFAGNLLHMYKVLWFVLEANYADFFAVFKKRKEITTAPPKPTAKE